MKNNLPTLLDSFKQRKFLKVEWINLFLLLSCGFAYLYYCFFYSVNFPFNDDFGQTLGYVDQIYASDSVDQFFTALFQQFNSHYIVSQRIVVLLFFEIFGHLNFEYLIIFGNIIYLSIILFLVQNSGIPVKSIVFVVLTCITCFIPVNMLSNWTGTSIVHSFVVLFGCLSLKLLVDKKNVIAAILFLIMALLSLGNSICIPIVGLFVMIYFYRDYKELIMRWVLFSSICLFLFFLFYQFEPGISSDKEFLDQLLNISKFFFAFNGAILRTFPVGDYQHNLCMIYGILIVAHVSYFLFFKKKFLTENKVVLSVIIYLLMTAAIVSLSRGKDTYLVSLSDRYQWYHMLISLCYFILIFKYYTITYKRLVISALLISIFGLNSYYFYAYNERKLSNHRLKMEDSILSFNTEDARYIAHPFRKQLVYQVLKKFEKKGLYKAPEIFTIQEDCGKIVDVVSMEDSVFELDYTVVTGDDKFWMSGNLELQRNNLFRDHTLSVQFNNGLECIQYRLSNFGQNNITNRVYKNFGKVLHEPHFKGLFNSGEFTGRYKVDFILEQGNTKYQFNLDDNYISINI